MRNMGHTWAVRGHQVNIVQEVSGGGGLGTGRSGEHN